MSPNGTNNPEQDTWTESEDMKWSAFVDQLYLAEKIIFIMFAIFTILGNTLVLVATWRERGLHQPNKYFVACLAVADLLVGMILEPLSVYRRNVRDYEPPTHLCHFTVWIDTFALAASIYTLTFISFDRYFKVRKPLQYRSRMTTSKSLKIISIISLISTALASYAVTPNSGSQGILSTSGGFCVDTEKKKVEGFYTFLAVILIFLPTVVILVMYGLIFIVVHKRQRMLRNGELGQTCNDRIQRSAFLRDLKTIRMLLVVVGVFILCWGPFFIYMMLFFHKANFADFDSYRTSFSYRRRVLIVQSPIITLAYFNSLCNPIIYACLDQTYREAFKNLFRRMMCGSRPRRRQPPEAIELPPLRTR